MSPNPLPKMSMSDPDLAQLRLRPDASVFSNLLSTSQENVVDGFSTMSPDENKIKQTLENSRKHADQNVHLNLSNCLDAKLEPSEALEDCGSSIESRGSEISGIPRKTGEIREGEGPDVNLASDLAHLPKKSGKSGELGKFGRNSGNLHGKGPRMHTSESGRFESTKGQGKTGISGTSGNNGGDSRRNGAVSRNSGDRTRKLVNNSKELGNTTGCAEKSGEKTGKSRKSGKSGKYSESVGKSGKACKSGKPANFGKIGKSGETPAQTNPKTAKSSEKSSSSKSGLSPASAKAGGREIAKSILYIGGLDRSITETTLENVLSTNGSVLSVKIITDKNKPGFSYAFVHFRSEEDAVEAIGKYNGHVIHQTCLNINFAYQSSTFNTHSKSHFHTFNLFVGDLSAEVDDEGLFRFFSHFASLKSAHVMWDMQTSRSRGYGFVTFLDMSDAETAIQTMNGKVLLGRNMRCNWASYKSPAGHGKRTPKSRSRSSQKYAPFSFSTLPSEYINGALGFLNQQFQPVSYNFNVGAFNTETFPKAQSQKSPETVDSEQENSSQNADTVGSKEENSLQNGGNVVSGNSGNPSVEIAENSLQNSGNQSVQRAENQTFENSGYGNPQNAENQTLHNPANPIFPSPEYSVPPMYGMYQNGLNYSVFQNGTNPQIGAKFPRHTQPSIHPQVYDMVLCQSPSWQTTVYIGNVAHVHSHDELVPLLQSFGFIMDLKLHPERGCAFCRYDTHEQAAMAIVQMSGISLNGRLLKSGWGKSRNHSQRQSQPYTQTENRSLSQSQAHNSTQKMGHGQSQRQGQKSQSYPRNLKNPSSAQFEYFYENNVW